MFPSNSPYRGPSSSFSLNQDRQGINHDLIVLFDGINSIASLINPNEIDVATPGLSSSIMAVNLPSVPVILGTGVGISSSFVLALSQYNDSYISLRVSGGPEMDDFDPTQLALQAIGLYTGSYLVVPQTLKSLYPLNISLGSLFWQEYHGVFPSVNGGWGPAVLAADGTGYAIRTSGGSGGIFRTLDGIVTGQALTLMSQNESNDGNGHHFKMGLQYLGLGTIANTWSYNISIYLDSSNIPSATYQDTTSPLNPIQVYPGFTSDGGNVFLYSWKWYNDDNTPVIGWDVNTLPYGTPQSLPITDGVQMFIVSTTTVPVAIRSLYIQQRVDNRISRLRSNINLLQAAYF